VLDCMRLHLESATVQQYGADALAACAAQGEASPEGVQRMVSIGFCDQQFMLAHCCCPLLLLTHCCWSLTAAAHSLLLVTHCCCPPTAAAHSLLLVTHCCCPLLLLTHCCCSLTAAVHSLLLLTHCCCPPTAAAHSLLLFLSPCLCLFICLCLTLCFSLPFSVSASASPSVSLCLPVPMPVPHSLFVSASPSASLSISLFLIEFFSQLAQVAGMLAHPDVPAVQRSCLHALEQHCGIQWLCKDVCAAGMCCALLAVLSTVCCALYCVRAVLPHCTLSDSSLSLCSLTMVSHSLSDSMILQLKTAFKTSLNVCCRVIQARGSSHDHIPARVSSSRRWMQNAQNVFETDWAYCGQTDGHGSRGSPGSD
jgi:hypothetical protein